MRKLSLVLLLALHCGAVAASACQDPTTGEQVPCPPPPPPPFSKKVYWRVIGAILGGCYGAVMLCVVISFWCCNRRRSAVQLTNLEAGLHEPQAAAATAVPTTFRSVDRGKSWVQRERAGEAPAFDLASIERSIKMAFVRKVYSILATQLVLTVGVVLGFVYAAFENTGNGPDPLKTTSLGEWVLRHGLVVILVSLIPILICICALHGFKNKYPLNYLLLFVFTAFESVTLGFLCVFYYAEGFGDQIILAAALTLLIFLSLTLFTMQSRIDWSFLGPAIMVMLIVMLFWSLFTFVLVPYNGGFVWRQLISLFGAIIFSLFIIYDTNNIMKHFGVDDYIIAAVELYLDVINLFRYLLMLLAATSRN